jgi:Flp pilus assembly pilin Flp
MTGNSTWTRIRACLRELLADQRAATAIEYAMIAAGVGATIAGTVLSFGSDLKTTFCDKVAAALR